MMSFGIHLNLSFDSGLAFDLQCIFRWIPFALLYSLHSPEHIFITNIFLVVLNSIQLFLRPFVGKWRNFLDGYFLLNLMILFSGSLYFNVRAEFGMRQQVLKQQTTFSTVFITLGYLGFAAMFTNHTWHGVPCTSVSVSNLLCLGTRQFFVENIASFTGFPSPAQEPGNNFLNGWSIQHSLAHATRDTRLLD